MNPNSYWSSKEDEILINFVRNHEAIYNIKSKDYRKTELKHNLWREIGEILNKSYFDCSKRWCYIRDYYVRRRGKSSTGPIGEAAKKRSELLSFLDSLPSPQKHSITNVVDEYSEDNNYKLENTHDNSEGTQTRGDSIIIIENTDSGEETQSNTQEIEKFICDNDRKKDDKATNDKKRKHTADVQEHLSLLNQNFVENGLDENDIFFGSMAKIVKKLPPYEQVQLRMQISSLVGNAELRHISNNSPRGKR